MKGEILPLGRAIKRCIHGGTPPLENGHYWEGDIPWITGADVANQKVQLPRRRVTRKAIDAKTTHVAEQGTLLVVTRTGIKKLAIAPFNLAISQDITGLVVNEEICTPRFIFWQLNAIAHKIDRLKQGTSIQGLLLEDLLRLKIWVPPKEAQKKAADSLDSIGDIEENARLMVEQTRRLKAAVAQDLLINAVLEKRFPVAQSRLGNLFTERNEKGRPGLPTMAITMNDGIMDREDMDRRIESALTPEEHLLACQGDLAYNMMRMWQGVSGLVPQDSLISPAYVVVTPIPTIDPNFAAHLFKLPEMIRLFHRYSQGLTKDRLRLYYHQFAEIPVTLPKNKADQQRIARLLTQLEQTAQAQETRLAQLQRTKTAISNQIFSHV